MRVRVSARVRDGVRVGGKDRVRVRVRLRDRDRVRVSVRLSNLEQRHQGRGAPRVDLARVRVRP